MSEDSETDFEGTEAQRKALEEMSQQLLDRLNSMVDQQEARAREFAERTHSLSSLPEQVQLPQMPSTPDSRSPQEPSIAPPTPAPAAKKAQHVPPPPQARRVDTTPRAAAPAEPAQPRVVRTPKRPAAAKNQEEDSKVGLGTLVTIGGIIFVLLRSCS